MLDNELEEVIDDALHKYLTDRKDKLTVENIAVKLGLDETWDNLERREDAIKYIEETSVYLGNLI